MPCLREALHLLEDGYRAADVDAALRGFGMPMGPFETMAEMGPDAAARAWRRWPARSPSASRRRRSPERRRQPDAPGGGTPTPGCCSSASCWRW